MGKKGHPGPNHKPYQYPPELWITIQSLYESGQFASLDLVYTHLKGMQPDIKLPSIQYTRSRAAKEGWNKHISDAEIAEKKAQSIGEMFEEYGMDLKERIRRNVMGITSIDKTISEINSLLNTVKTKIEEQEITEEVCNALETVMEGVPRLAQGLKIQLEYLKNSHALCGDNAPEKKHLMGDGLKKAVKDDSDLTSEELNKELERLLKVRRGV